MQRSLRLTRTTDFKRVRQFGKSQAHPLIVLVALPNQQPHSRFGVAAGRSVGKAVQRNRAKRLLRAALQSLLPAIMPGWDIVLLARRAMADASYQQTREALLILFQRARLLQANYEC